MVEYEKIYLVDSLSAVVAVQMLCDTALKRIAQGKTAEEIVEELEEVKGRTRIFAALDTLEYLAMGGRISKAAAAIGEMANIKPVITVNKEGKVDVIGKGLGINRTLGFLQKKVEEAQIDEQYPIYSLFSYGEENCGKLEQRLEKKGYQIQARRQICPAIGTHIGPEAFGICFCEK